MRFITSLTPAGGRLVVCRVWRCAGQLMLRTDLRPELLNIDTFAGIGRGDRVAHRGCRAIRRHGAAALARTIRAGHRRFGPYGAGRFSDEARALAESGLVQRWFSTNYDRSAYSELITGFPLGLNYARKNELIGLLHPQGWLRVDMKPPSQQEEEWVRRRGAGATAGAPHPQGDRRLLHARFGAHPQIR